MARPIRVEFENAFYHVLNRGLEKRRIFQNNSDYDGFIKRLLEIYRRFDIVIYAYCLMPNHYHLFVKTPKPNLQKAMRHLNSSYTITFNKSHQRVGPLFQGRYKAILVEAESYAMELIRYIHLNPVRAKMVELPENYTCSSFGFYLNPKNSSDFLDTGWALSQFNNKRTLFKKFTYEGLSQDFDPQKKVKHGFLLGGADFIDEIKEKYLLGSKDRELSKIRHCQKPTDISIYKKIIRKLTPNKDYQTKMLAYLLKKYTSLTLKEIQGILGAKGGYSALSHLIHRWINIGQTSSSIKQLIERAEEEVMSHVKT